MNKIAQLLGLIGGIRSFILISLIILVIRVRHILDRASSAQRFAGGIFIWSYVIFIFALLGIVGATLVRTKPRVGGILMLVSGGGGLVAIVIRIITTTRLGGGDLIEGIFFLLVITAGILGTISSSRLPQTNNDKNV